MESENNTVGIIDDGQITLTAWEAKGKFTDEQYIKITEQFGATPLTEDILQRFEIVTGVKRHPLLGRGIFSAHRDFDKILDDFEAGKPIYIYSGRGPSGNIHLGHSIPIEFTVYLQKAFKAVVVFMMADLEKTFFKDLDFETTYKLGFENARDIIAMGFDPEKTFIFSMKDFSTDLYYQQITMQMMKNTPVNEIKSIFGIKDDGNCGMLVWPFYQTVAAYSKAFATIFGVHDTNIRCLVCYAIDQDCYFRLGRNRSMQMGFLKPASLMCKFLPALEGESKMSTSEANGECKTIFLHDTYDEIDKKIKKYAFSGGQDNIKLHRELGGNCDVDICYQWLRYMLESDTELLKIREAYQSGKMLTSELKKITIKVVSDRINEHKKKKEMVTDDIVKQFYEIRQMKLR